jgi:hypothetical protein
MTKDLLFLIVILSRAADSNRERERSRAGNQKTKAPGQLVNSQQRSDIAKPREQQTRQTFENDIL